MRIAIEEYLKQLEAGNAEKIAALFDENGIVNSPLYGKRPAKDFFKSLFSDTTKSKLTLLNIFNSEDKPHVYALHFKYEWTLKNGQETGFECVDVFEFNTHGKIREMTIIYDTYKTRETFKTLS